MKRKKIITYGNELLRKVSENVTDIDGKIVKLSNHMIEIIKNCKGVGLAAVQIGSLHRVIAIQRDEKDILVIVNPEIVSLSFPRYSIDEGCLSLPGIYSPISRAKKITIKATGLDGKEIFLKTEGLTARILQHEIDHLNGKLFIDYLTENELIMLEDDLKNIKKQK